jgi:2-dehydro-3-deoxyglucarate aldolase/4-hydroxy-2-oxoheptanedioate aldolase
MPTDNLVKKALAAGRVQYGTNLGQLGSPDIVRILAAAGFHWAFLDMEHGSYGIETIRDLCRVSPSVRFTPIVRVPELQYPLVTRALDVGAQGIVFPRVESPKDLERAVSWTRTPPEGVRGFGLGAFHFGFEPLSVPEMIQHLNRNTLVVLQIETKRAIEARHELLSVPGVDVVMVGPADLSISMGIPGEFEDPRMVGAIESIRDACVEHKVVPGIHVRSPKLAQFWQDRGMLFLSCSSEVAMIYERAREIITGLAPVG